ncbi:MAG: hypothetical protein JXN59_07890 [Anaerolineae bacterium]|nr:hypothetical protein [Anaerolineae bacterium]
MPLFTIPRRRPSLVYASALAGLAALLWLGGEDTRLLPVTALALCLTVLLCLATITGRYAGRRLTVRGVILAGGALGAGCGIGTALTTTSLMLFKIALHGHPDYSWAMFQAVLARAPGWGLGGALIGLGMALLWVAVALKAPPN